MQKSAKSSNVICFVGKLKNIKFAIIRTVLISYRLTAVSL